MLLIEIWIWGTLFLPYIIGAVLSAVIILLIRKKLINKDKEFKTLIYAIIIIFCVLLSRNIGYPAMGYLSDKPDKVYSEMKKINDSQKLIGLSKDEVVILLGEPLYTDDNMYIYDAGTTANYFFFGEKEFYDLFVKFDENDIVKSTRIDFKRGG